MNVAYQFHVFFHSIFKLTSKRPKRDACKTKKSSKIPETQTACCFPPFPLTTCKTSHHLNKAPKTGSHWVEVVQACTAWRHPQRRGIRPWLPGWRWSLLVKLRILIIPTRKIPLKIRGSFPMYIYIYIYKLYTWYLRVGPKICTRRCVAALLAFSLGDGGPSWWSGSPPKWVERFWWDFFTSKIPRNITEVLRLPSIFTWSFSTCVVYFDYRIIIIGSWDG